MGVVVALARPFRTCSIVALAATAARTSVVLSARATIVVNTRDCDFGCTLLFPRLVRACVKKYEARVRVTATFVRKTGRLFHAIRMKCRSRHRKRMIRTAHVSSCALGKRPGRAFLPPER